MRKKIHLIDEMGIDHLFIATFDKDMAQTTKEAFIEQLKALHVKKTCVGYRF